MSKSAQQIDALCLANDRLRELWRLRHKIVDAAIKWDLDLLKKLVAEHESLARNNAAN